MSSFCDGHILLNRYASREHCFDVQSKNMVLISVTSRSSAVAAIADRTAYMLSVIVVISSSSLLPIYQSNNVSYRYAAETSAWSVHDVWRFLNAFSLQSEGVHSALGAFVAMTLYKVMFYLLTYLLPRTDLVWPGRVLGTVILAPLCQVLCSIVWRKHFDLWIFDLSEPDHE